MSFAAPAMLLGMAAAAVPLVIHLVGRRRAPRHRFAAIDFVLRSDRRLARRLRARQILLLVVRMGLAAGIALMMAKPFVEEESALPAVGGQAQSAVLIIDDTLSMRRRVDGRMLFTDARQKASQLVRMMGGQAEVAVLALSRPGGPLPALTGESRRVLAAIARMEPGKGHATLSTALTQAVRILAGSTLDRRLVFVLSDVAAHGIVEPPRAMLQKQGIRFHMVDVVGSRGVDNVAVVEVSAAPSSAPGQRTARVNVRVCNHGKAAVRRKVTLSVDGAEVSRGYLPLEPWSCNNKSFQHSFARGGMHNASVAVEADQLAEDDVRHLRLEVGSAIRVLLVNGAPSPVRHRDELFYLETALATPGPGGQPINTDTVNVDELGPVRFSGYDVVALCNVRALPVERAPDLRSFVEKGGGLLVALGDNVDPAAYNSTLGDLLPAPLRGALTAAPPGTGAPALRIGRVESGHPLLAPLWSGGAGGGLRKAQFKRVYRLRPSASEGKRVVMWYDDGSPALVEAQRGDGRVLLFSSTLDRDWNDMAIRPGYLPLVLQLMRYLSRVPLHAPRRSVEVGSAVTFRLPEKMRQLRLDGPAGLEQLWTTRELEGRTSVEIPAPDPGFYRLSVTGADGVVQVLERESFMANVNPAESDLRKAHLTSDRAGQGGGGRATRRRELWHALGVVLLLLLLGESFISRRG